MNAILVFGLRLLLVLLSYTFVGWIGYTIYMDLQRHVRAEKKGVVTPISLSAEVEPEPIEKRFLKPEIIIGRDPACDFPLDDETISVRHCKLSYRNKNWWAEDLNSTNGSYLNDSPLHTATILTDGDLLQLGFVNLHVKLND